MCTYIREYTRELVTGRREGSTLSAAHATRRRTRMYTYVRASRSYAHSSASVVPIMDMQAAKQVPFIHVRSALVAYHLQFPIYHLPSSSPRCTCCPSPLFLILVRARARERPAADRAARLLTGADTDEPSLKTVFLAAEYHPRGISKSIV